MLWATPQDGHTYSKVHIQKVSANIPDHSVCIQLSYEWEKEIDMHHASIVNG